MQILPGDVRNRQSLASQWRRLRCWRTHEEYLLSISGAFAFSSYRHLIDRRWDVSNDWANSAWPLRSNASLALSFSLSEPLRSLHQVGDAGLASSGGSSDHDSSDLPSAFADGILPPAAGQTRSLDAIATIDLHSLSSSESGLLAICLHLRAIQQRVAVLRAQHAAAAVPANAAELLGFRSLTIICGRGNNATPQGYSLTRVVVFEALVRFGMAPILLAYAGRTRSSVPDSVTIDSADLWQWCVANINADRQVTLEWLQRTL